MNADADCAQINPFVFKNKARHRFSDKSQKYLLKRSLEEVPLFLCIKKIRNDSPES
jgi:hypothetical protein